MLHFQPVISTMPHLHYLAIPYHGTDEEKAYRTALSMQATTVFLKQGIHVFSPVLYVNPIAEQMNFASNAERREVVMPYLLSFLAASQSMILVTADRWEDSLSVRQELEFCLEHSIPVYLVSPSEVVDAPSRVLDSPLEVEEIRQLVA